MRHMISRALCVLAVAATVATVAQAQTSPAPPAQQPVPSTPTIKLTMEDQHVLKENLLKTPQSEGNAGQSDLERGKKVPASVQLQRFPEEVAGKIPQIKSHEYFIAGHAIVIVEPQQRSIVEVVK